MSAAKASLNPSGWADDRLSVAFDAIDDVLTTLSDENDAFDKLRKALDLIEQADVDMEKGR